MKTKPLYALPERQRDTMQAIIDHIKRHKQSPTLDEIATAIGSQKGIVQGFIRGLIERGYITTHPNRHRSITIVEG